MAKAPQGQILIKTPRTSNGRDLIIGEDGKRVYKETIVEAAARSIFEKQNETRPTPLKHIIEDIKPPVVVLPDPVANEPIQATEINQPVQEPQTNVPPPASKSKSDDKK